MCSWAFEIEEHEDTFQTEAYTDGDVFQAMAALARVNFFGIDSSSDEGSQASSSNNDNIQHDKGEQVDDPRNDGEDNDVVHIHNLRNEVDSDDSCGSVRYFDSGPEDLP